MAGPLILLVDDASDVGLIVRRLGERAGQRVEVRPSAELAWEYLQTVRPDLAILDVNLPGVSGPELCWRIRGDPNLARLPIAILGHPDRPDDLAAGLKAGADFLFSKDLLTEPGQWIERIQEALDGADPAAPPQADGCTHLLARVSLKLGEPVAAALRQRFSGHFEMDLSSNAEVRPHLERVLGRRWLARLGTP